MTQNLDDWQAKRVEAALEAFHRTHLSTRGQMIAIVQAIDAIPYPEAEALVEDAARIYYESEPDIHLPTQTKITWEALTEKRREWIKKNVAEILATLSPLIAAKDTEIAKLAHIIEEQRKSSEETVRLIDRAYDIHDAEIAAKDARIAEMEALLIRGERIISGCLNEYTDISRLEGYDWLHDYNTLTDKETV